MALILAIGFGLQLWTCFTKTNQRLHYFQSFEDSDLLPMTRSQLRYNDFASTYLMGRWAPRIIYLNSPETIHSSNRTVELLGGPCPYCEREPDDFILPIERPYYEQCTPMADWQEKYYPTCNGLHEISLGEPATFSGWNTSRNDTSSNDDHPNNQSSAFSTTDLVELLSLSGSWRSAWRKTNQFNETVVLKLLRYHNREFDHESFRYHRIDAMAMERLTSSPYIVDIYGFCGESVLTEYATGSARLHLKNKHLGSKERLVMGRDIARALAALHSIDYPDSTNVTFTHNDINVANAVEVNGRIKLNDFNIGNLLRWNGTKPCGSPVRFMAPFWKSPEENRARDQYVDAAKTDVYGLGNLLFQVLTTRQPWTHLEPNGTLTVQEIVERKEAGLAPTVPDKVVQSKKVAIQALYFATMACFRYRPEDRPTSHELAESLNRALKWARSGKKVTPEQVEALFAVKHTS